MTHTSQSPKPRTVIVGELAAVIEPWLRVLVEPGQVVELRALNVPQKYGRPTTQFGYFDSDSLNVMAREAANLTVGNATGVYWTLNPVNPDLVARAANRIRLAKSDETTSDRDVIRRRWLLIDADPKRPAGISASDDEKEHARQVAVAVDAFLFDAGWPAPTGPTRLKSLRLYELWLRN